MFGTISQTFGRAFLVAHLLPAGLLTASVAVAMKAEVLKKGWAAYWPVFGASREITVLVVIFIVAVVLSLLSSEITRIFEGYSQLFFLWLAIAAAVSPFLIAWFVRGEFGLRWPIERLLLIVALASILVYGLHDVGRIHHRKMFKHFKDQLDREHPEQKLRRYRFVRAYPQDEALVLPTGFGNILRAFEHYPRYMFGIDPITMWFRLLPVISEPLRTQLEIAESTTKFFVNLSFVAVLMACGATYVGLRMRWPIAGSLAVALLIVGHLIYRLACRAAIQWGETVRSAFDLHRFDLMKKLSVHIDNSVPWSLATERKIWMAMQSVTYYARPESTIAFNPTKSDKDV